ncbi:MAG: hypothetical protein JWN76_533 [Chitinophagaceae bacterium]|nr:hypothetical protein [Chitinophagaceae bacterium]
MSRKKKVIVGIVSILTIVIVLMIIEAISMSSHQGKSETVQLQDVKK